MYIAVLIHSPIHIIPLYLTTGKKLYTFRIPLQPTYASFPQCWDSVEISQRWGSSAL